MTAKVHDKVLLAHGGGGQLSDALIRRHILPALQSDPNAALGDSAILPVEQGTLCFTTDSYVVKPLFFNGGDIGTLAVCGTINDLAVAGAVPLALSLGLIIEDGLPFKVLDKILAGIGQVAREHHVRVVTGDTKTVEAGSADRIFINTSGIGVRLACADMGFDRIAAGDQIIISGTIGDHGLTIISQRKGIRFESELRSDCAALLPLTKGLLEAVGAGVKFMRDPTRGGLAATLNEIASATGLGIEIQEADIPVDPTVQAAADMLGFDLLNIANEGKLVAVVSPDRAQEALAVLRVHPLGSRAQIIGCVTRGPDVSGVEMVTRIGGRRIVQMPYGRELPRIC